MPTRNLLAAIFILWAGFSIRAALYDYHGLEGDDGYSLSLTRLDTPDLLTGLAALELDIHPPLHFLALKGWIALAGDSLIALRMINILADVLAGALVMRTAGRLGSRRIAWAAGLLWAVAPLLIYSDALIRMYALLAFFAAAGLACLMEAHADRRVGLWYAGSAFFGLLAAETHIVGALILASLAAGMLVDGAILSRRRLTHLAIGVGAFLAAGLVYAPYFQSVWALYRSGRSLGAEISEAAFQDPLSALAATVQTALTHRLFPGAWVGFLILPLLLGGSILLWRTRWRRSMPFLAVTTIQLTGMAILAWTAGFYKARYLNPLTPPLLILIGGVVTLLNRRGQILAFALILTVSAGGVLKDLERTYRDDWVAAATFIEQHERPGDRIIVIPDWGQDAFKYHYRGHAPVVGLFPQVSSTIDYQSVLAEQVVDAARVWYVHYQPEISDPDQLAEQWFRQRAATLTEVFPAGMHLHYYDFRPQLTALPGDVHSLDARFGGVLQLRGVYLPVTIGSAQDARLHPPSNWVQVILYWEALRDQPEGTPRVRLTDPYAQVYGAALERDQDVQHRNPVVSWQAGSIWEVAYDLNLNPETPPGVYNIEVMVLDTAGQPLPTEGADAGEFWAIAGQFTIQ